MALTAAEMAELAQLEKEVGHHAPPAGGGLSDAESKELASLESEVGHLAPKAKAQPGVAQTALEAFGNGATLGYLPQLQAAAEPVVTWIGNKVTGQNLEPEDYLTSRDRSIARQKAQAEANPATSAIAKGAGMLTSGIATGGILPEAGAGGTVAARVGQGALQGARTGAIYGLAENPGDVEGKLDPVQAAKRVENAGKGAVAGGIAGAALPLAAQAVKSTAGAASSGLKSFAEKAAANATGATGKQLSTFDENAGRELLDRGIVKFGDTQKDIAARASKAVDDANGQIDSALQKLKDQGVTVDADAIKAKIQDRIKEMAKNASTSDIRSQLQRELSSLDEAIGANGGKDIDVLTAEQTKRGYSRKAGNWMDPEKSQAGKEMYGQFKSGVEDAATAADPTTAELFKKGKETYGLLAPIQEAAERRAQTQNQSPWGGLGDTVAAIKGALGGAAFGGPIGGAIGGAAGIVGRRAVAPRLASSVAVTADAAANLLRKQPGMADLETKFPAVFQGIVQHITQSSDGTPVGAAADAAPVKGREKWVQDGLQKLQDHAGEGEQETLDKVKGALSDDPKTKDLVIAASDLKPGTKAMASVMAKLKARTTKDNQ